MVSVGNLTVGGTGKTPIVAWLAGRMLADGRTPAVVSRGYGGTAGRGPLRVSDGSGPSCPAAVSGDEPYMLARSVPGAIVVVGSDRCAGAEPRARRGSGRGHSGRRFPASAPGARPGHRSSRGIPDPSATGRLIPAGPLREPVSELRRANLILVTRSRGTVAHPSIERTLRLFNPEAPILRSDHQAVGFHDPAGEPVERPARALAFCGIGNPERFRRDLQSMGTEIVGFRPFRDHHRFTRRELQSLHRQAERQGAVLVTTEKDQVRIANTNPPILTLRIAADPFEPGRLWQAVLDALFSGTT